MFNTIVSFACICLYLANKVLLLLLLLFIDNSKTFLYRSSFSDH